MLIELKAKKEDEDYGEEGETGGDSKKRKQRAAAAKCEETTKKIQEYLASGNIELPPAKRPKAEETPDFEESRELGTEIQEDSVLAESPDFSPTIQDFTTELSKWPYYCLRMGQSVSTAIIVPNMDETRRLYLWRRPLSTTNIVLSHIWDIVHREGKHFLVITFRAGAVDPSMLPDEFRDMAKQFFNVLENAKQVTFQFEVRFCRAFFFFVSKHLSVWLNIFWQRLHL